MKSNTTSLNHIGKKEGYSEHAIQMGNEGVARNDDVAFGFEAGRKV